MLWTLQRLLINWDCTVCVSEGGTSRLRVQQVETDFTKDLIGYQIHLKNQCKSDNDSRTLNIIYYLLRTKITYVLRWVFLWMESIEGLKFTILWALYFLSLLICTVLDCNKMNQLYSVCFFVFFSHVKFFYIPKILEAIN